MRSHEHITRIAHMEEEFDVRQQSLNKARKLARFDLYDSLGPIYKPTDQVRLSDNRIGEVTQSKLTLDDLWLYRVAAWTHGRYSKLLAVWYKEEDLTPNLTPAKIPKSQTVHRKDSSTKQSNELSTLEKLMELI